MSVENRMHPPTKCECQCNCNCQPFTLGPLPTEKRNFAAEKQLGEAICEAMETGNPVTIKAQDSGVSPNMNAAAKIEIARFQRFGSDGKWYEVDVRDIQHYESKGQQIRPLYATSPTFSLDAWRKALFEVQCLVHDGKNQTAFKKISELLAAFPTTEG